MSRGLFNKMYPRMGALIAPRVDWRQVSFRMGAMACEYRGAQEAISEANGWPCPLSFLLGVYDAKSEFYRDGKSRFGPPPDMAG